VQREPPRELDYPGARRLESFPRVFSGVANSDVQTLRMIHTIKAITTSVPISPYPNMAFSVS
jgi:hypothetical protein